MANRRFAPLLRGRVLDVGCDRALLRQLVREAHVRESDIVVYDASRWVNDSISTAPQAIVAAPEAFAGEVDEVAAA